LSGDRLSRWITLAMVVVMFGIAGPNFAGVGNLQGVAKIAPPIVVNDDDPENPTGSSSPPLANSTLVAAPANDTCAGAVVLTLDRITKGTTIGAANDYQTPATAACFPGIGQTPTTAPGRDIVFKFTPPNTRQYSFRIV